MKIGASTIGRSLWCHEESDVKVVEKVKLPETKTTSRGSLLHEKYDALHRKSYGNLERILKKLEPFRHYPKSGEEQKRHGKGWFERKFEGHVIRGDPDWFAQRHFRKIAILEDKTIVSKEAGKFRVPCAVLQLQTYCFIMKPIFEKIGYALAPIHKIFYYYARTSEPLAIREVTYNELEYQHALRKLIRIFERKANPIPPAPFKCLQCRKLIRDKCRIFPLYGRKRTRRAKTSAEFHLLSNWGQEWEIELRTKLENVGHYIRNKTGEYWVSEKLGGIKGLDFACLNCGMWFEAKRRTTPYFTLNAHERDLKPYRTMNIWLCFKNPHGVFYIKGSDLIANLDQARLLRNRWGEPFYRWDKRKTFSSLRMTVPPCKIEELKS